MALETVPDGVSVVTMSDYAAHLARRSQLYVLGIPSQREVPLNPDVVFLYLCDRDYILCDDLRTYFSRLDRERYGVTFRTGGVIVLQRDTGDLALFRDFVENWNNCAG